MVKDKSITLNASRLILGAIILLLLWLLLKPTNVDLSKYDKQKQQIDKLKNNIELLKSSQKLLNKQLIQQNRIVDSLNIEIKNTEKELQQTRTYYGNKIKDLTSASNSELEQFFSDRYR